jgi:hypothetical protein
VGEVSARERVVAENDSLLVPGNVLDVINRDEQHPPSQAADPDLEQIRPVDAQDEAESLHDPYAPTDPRSSARTREPRSLIGLAHASDQSRMTFPAWPERATANASSNSRWGKRWVITGLISSPDWSITVIWYQVSYISRP